MSSLSPAIKGKEAEDMGSSEGVCTVSLSRTPFREGSGDPLSSLSPATDGK